MALTGFKWLNEGISDSFSLFPVAGSSLVALGGAAFAKKKELRQDWARAAGFPHLAGQLEKRPEELFAGRRRCHCGSEANCRASCKQPGPLKAALLKS